MATETLSVNKPIEVKTLLVSVTTDAPPGKYRLSLVVVGEAGQESAPVEQDITIQKAT